jgi:hypothetical protein
MRSYGSRTLSFHRWTIAGLRKAMVPKPYLFIGGQKPAYDKLGLKNTIFS